MQNLAGAPAETRSNSVSPGVIYAAKFPDAQGRTQSLAQWENRLLVINFWATWCGPCKEEIPILKNLQAKFGGQGLQIVGIAADTQSNVANFGKNVDINYPLLVAETGAIEFSRRMGNRLGLLPHTLILRPAGEVVYSKLGLISEVEMVAIITKNLPKSN
ncbi:MAG: TlpA disulfide reductase family protein [Betaproteobacteria bacterium]